MIVYHTQDTFPRIPAAKDRRQAWRQGLDQGRVQRSRGDVRESAQVCHGSGKRPLQSGLRQGRRHVHLLPQLRRVLAPLPGSVVLWRLRHAYQLRGKFLVLLFIVAINYITKFIPFYIG